MCSAILAIPGYSRINSKTSMAHSDDSFTLADSNSFKSLGIVPIARYFRNFFFLIYNECV